MNHSRYQDPRHWYESLATFYASASMLVTDDAEKILLVKPNYRDYWSLPGGMVDQDEDPAHCAAREVREEVGLTLVARGPLAIAWEPANGGRPKARISFYFSGGPIPADQDVQPDLQELDGAGFFSLSDALPMMPAMIARHLTAAWQARTCGRLAYVEAP